MGAIGRKGAEGALCPPKCVDLRPDRGISCLAMATRPLTPDHHNAHRLQVLRILPRLSLSPLTGMPLRLYIRAILLRQRPHLRIQVTADNEPWPALANTLPKGPLEDNDRMQLTRA